MTMQRHRFLTRTAQCSKTKAVQNLDTQDTTSTVDCQPGTGVVQRPVKGCTAATTDSSSGSADNAMSGRERRKLGMAKQKRTIAALRHEVATLHAQKETLMGILDCMQRTLGANSAAATDLPLIFDIYGGDVHEVAVQTSISVDWSQPDIFVTMPQLPNTPAHADAAAGEGLRDCKSISQDFNSHDLALSVSAPDDVHSRQCGWPLPQIAKDDPLVQPQFAAVPDVQTQYGPLPQDFNSQNLANSSVSELLVKSKGNSKYDDEHEAISNFKDHSEKTVGLADLENSCEHNYELKANGTLLSEHSSMHKSSHPSDEHDDISPYLTAFEDQELLINALEEQELERYGHLQYNDEHEAFSNFKDLSEKNVDLADVENSYEPNNELKVNGTLISEPSTMHKSKHTSKHESTNASTPAATISDGGTDPASYHAWSGQGMATPGVLHATSTRLRNSITDSLDDVEAESTHASNVKADVKSKRNSNHDDGHEAFTSFKDHTEKKVSFEHVVPSDDDTVDGYINPEKLAQYETYKAQILLLPPTERLEQLQWLTTWLQQPLLTRCKGNGKGKNKAGKGKDKSKGKTKAESSVC